MIKKLLLAHAIIEMIAGVLLIMNPAIIRFESTLSVGGVHFAKMYGILAFCFGIVCYQLYKLYSSTEAFRKIILTIMMFHLLIGLYLMSLWNTGVLTMPAAGTFHLGFAFFMAVTYMREEAGKREG